MAAARALILLALVACREDTPARAPEVAAPPPRLTGDGIGCLSIGAPLATLAGECRIVADRVVPGPEGTQERRVDIAVGADTLTATIAGDSVWRAEITSERVRTADGIGVGTAAGELLARSGSRVVGGEGRLFITLEDHCGVSFELGQVPRELLGVSPEQAAERIPRESPVTRVLVFGCGSRP